MKTYSWIVLTNCAPGNEARFNAWYDTTHIDDLLRIPGIVSASRSRLAKVQIEAGDGPPNPALSYQFLAIYKLCTDDVEGVIKEIRRRSNTSEMYVSDDLTEALTTLYEDL